MGSMRGAKGFVSSPIRGLLSSWLFSTFLLTQVYAESSGASYVQTNYPEFYYIARSIVREQLASNSEMDQTVSRFFSGWGSQEITAIKQMMSDVVLHASISAAYSQPNGDYTTQLRGLFGELIGSAEIRRRYKIPEPNPHGPLFFLSELEYRNLNRECKRCCRPDGIVYSIDGSSLRIHQVLESKLGEGHYRRRQADGYLKTWRNRGLTTPQGYFSAIDIVVDDFAMDARRVSVEQLERITLVVLTKAPPRHGIKRFFSIYVLDIKDNTLKTIARALYNKALEALDPVKHLRSVLEDPAIALEDRIDLVLRYIRHEHRLPRDDNPNPVERYLADFIRTNGGVLKIMSYLDDATRALFTKPENPPALCTSRVRAIH